MKRLGVVLLVLGIVAIVLALRPQLGGVEKPKEGFGPMQITTIVIGGVLGLLGIVLCCCGKCSCAAPAAEAPPAAEPPAEAPAEEPPKEEEKPREGPGDD